MTPIITIGAKVGIRVPQLSIEKVREIIKQTMIKPKTNNTIRPSVLGN